MGYTSGQMVYRKDYKWSAKADADDPGVRGGKEREELNRSEGYEMLDFINKLANGWKWGDAPVESYRNLEKIIKNRVPDDIHQQDAIQKWIEDNFKGIKDQKF